MRVPLWRVFLHAVAPVQQAERAQKEGPENNVFQASHTGRLHVWETKGLTTLSEQVSDAPRISQVVAMRLSPLAVSAMQLSHTHTQEAFSAASSDTRKSRKTPTRFECRISSGYTK